MKGLTPRTLGACVLAALAVACAGCDRRKAAPPAPAAPGPAAAPAPATDRVVVGHVAALTGGQAALGQSSDRGVRLAVNEQNARGGVKGRVVELRTVDDQGRPEEAAAAAARLVQQERALVLIGEDASSRSVAMAPVADANETPMVSPSSTAARVTRDGDRTRPYVFRVCFGDAFQGAAMAHFAREALKVERVAILRDAADEDAAALAQLFARKLEELGGTRIADEGYRAGDQDFRAQLGSIKARDPQALYLPGSYADVAAIARQARELGMAQPLLGGDRWDSARLAELGGRALDGSYFIAPWAPDDPEPRVREFVRHFREAWGEAPDGLAALGYDAARVALDAAARAAELRGPSVKDALAATKAFPGVTGSITLDADHEPAKAAVILAVKGGAARAVATVKP